MTICCFPTSSLVQAAAFRFDERLEKHSYFQIPLLSCLLILPSMTAVLPASLEVLNMRYSHRVTSRSSTGTMKSLLLLLLLLMLMLLMVFGLLQLHITAETVRKHTYGKLSTETTARPRAKEDIGPSAPAHRRKVHVCTSPGPFAPLLLSAYNIAISGVHEMRSNYRVGREGRSRRTDTGLRNRGDEKGRTRGKFARFNHDHETPVCEKRNTQKCLHDTVRGPRVCTCAALGSKTVTPHKARGSASSRTAGIRRCAT